MPAGFHFRMFHVSGINLWHFLAHELLWLPESTRNCTKFHFRFYFSYTCDNFEIVRRRGQCPSLSQVSPSQRFTSVSCVPKVLTPRLTSILQTLSPHLFSLQVDFWSLFLSTMSQNKSSRIFFLTLEGWFLVKFLRSWTLS